jgi:hypothetical protein
MEGESMRLARVMSLAILAGSLLGLTLQQTPKPTDKEIRLFNGKDLTGWDYYLADPNAKMEDVWSVDREQGILICKGSPPGYLYTKQDYTNFILKLEWRWAPGKPPGNSGVLLRVHGEHKIWPRSIEAQLMYMNAGDFWLIDGAPLETDPEFVDKNTPRHRWRKKDRRETRTRMERVRDYREGRPHHAEGERRGGQRGLGRRGATR